MTFPVQLVPVKSRSERERFVQLPWSLYRDDPLWAPPLMWERRAFVDRRRHPFYQFGDADLFLATDQGRDVGRIMVSDDPHYNQFHGSNAGMFGMFESINDPRVAEILLSAARRWLRDRGRKELLGPIDYSTNYTCGLLVNGFDTPPRLMMNHNPPYYADLFTANGLAKAKDMYAWWFEPNAQIEQWRHRVEKLAARGNITLRPFRRDRWREEIAICKDIYHQAWRDKWGFSPMTDTEFQAMATQMLAWAESDMFLMAEVAGEPVGFSMTMPDLNEALRPLNGRLFTWGLPLGYFRFRRELRRIRNVRMMALGVLQAYRRRGIAELLMLRTFDTGRQQLGYTGAELSWTLEDNDLINRVIQSVGGRLYKTYRVYRQAL
ncbi:MAG: hypothetical protein SFX18_09920 [Pirellulales bacterium]|nr:hypothetical protein [Pirellulales bacterium]